MPCIVDTTEDNIEQLSVENTRLKGALCAALRTLTAHDLLRGERVVQIRWLREIYRLSFEGVVREFNRIRAARIKEIEDHIRS